MSAVDKIEDEVANLFGRDGENVLRDVGFSRIESGSVSSELLNFLVSEESSELDDEKEVLDSLREKSRDRLE